MPFSARDMFYEWEGLNLWLFRKINGGGGAAYGKLMVWLDTAGEHENFKYYFGATFLSIALIWLSARIRGNAVSFIRMRHYWALLITMVMGFALYGFLIGLLKTMFAMPRPFMILRDPPGSMQFFGAYPDPADYYTSFPHESSATLMFMYWLLKPYIPVWARFPAMFCVLAVGWGGIASGMVFPADIVGGWLVGIFAAKFVRRYVYRMMGLDRKIDIVVEKT